MYIHIGCASKDTLGIDRDMDVSGVWFSILLPRGTNAHGDYYKSRNIFTVSIAGIKIAIGKDSPAHADLLRAYENPDETGREAAERAINIIAQSLATPAMLALIRHQAFEDGKREGRVSMAKDLSNKIVEIATT